MATDLMSDTAEMVQIVLVDMIWVNALRRLAETLRVLVKICLQFLQYRWVILAQETWQKRIHGSERHVLPVDFLQAYQWFPVLKFLE